MDAKLSTNMNANKSTAAGAKRKGPSKPRVKNTSKGSVEASAAKPSKPCVGEPSASSDMSTAVPTY